MLTVRELLRDLDVRLLTGEPALDLPVRWVHISELPDPTPWLSGGELLLSTGMQLDTSELQAEFITRLADHQLAGLGFGTGFRHDEVPPALLEVAAAREFPVFEVPYELPFIAVTEAAFTRLVNEQYAVLRRALSAHDRLERILLSEGGLESLAGTLATQIGAAVLVFDARGEPLVQRAFRRSVEPDAVAAISAELRERSRRRDARAFLPSHGEDEHRGLALPVATDGRPGPDAGVERILEAWLVAIKDSGPMSDFDRLTLHQAVTIVALELLRRRVAGDTERRLAGDVLAAVVRGELAGPDLARRLEPFGLAERVAAIVVERPKGRRGSSGPVEGALVGALREEALAGLVASSDGLTCALVPGMEEEELFTLAERVGELASSELDTQLRVGAGRAVPGGEARRSFHEARCAIEAVSLGVTPIRNGNGSGSTRGRPATYKDLGAFQLLLSLQDDEALRLFCDSILGPIEASEGHYGGELMRSLEAFIEENGQWERAAKRLYCHRHTLRYRIRRVEELTGRNLGSARDRIEFWLALRGRELVDAGHEVFVQSGAGEGSAIPDDGYTAQGATIVPDADAVFGEATLIVKVKEPQPAEISRLEPRHTLFTYLHLAADAGLATGLADSGATCIAYETVEDSRGRLPLLAPMSEVAGKIATQAGAFMLEKPLGGRGILLGGVPGVTAANVMIIGGGVVGMNAAFIALGMEATVFVFDRNIDRLRELDIAFQGRADTCFATTLSIEERLPDVDLVIGAVLVHGARAPHVITRPQLGLMKRQAVLVDVSIDQGGCFETSRPTTHTDPTYEVDGITHYCVTNMPGAVPITSTYALTNATMPYVLHIASAGVHSAVKESPGLKLGVNVAAGQVTYAPVAEAVGVPYVPVEEALADVPARVA